MFLWSSSRETNSTILNLDDTLKMLAWQEQDPKLIQCLNCSRLRTIRYDEADYCPL